MDESIIVSVIGIAITIFFGQLLDLGKKKSDSHGADAPRPQQRVRRIVHQPQANPESLLETTESNAPKTRHESIRPTIAAQGTQKPKEMPKAQPKVTLPTLDRDGVRNALIWGEILQRKF